MTLAVASLLLAAGIFARCAAAVVFLAFSYINLMDASFYLNHFYLSCLVALLFVAVPSARRGSVVSFWRARISRATGWVPSRSV